MAPLRLSTNGTNYTKGGVLAESTEDAESYWGNLVTGLPYGGPQISQIGTDKECLQLAKRRKPNLKPAF
ncbi:hypothetical protein ACFFF3_09510 [Mongoliitalea lutea]|uniref:Uncharacterized protein n=1 Tax=Mongoliitalea lutea TaxID=849756 RepID=A0A8J3G6Y8_9BACT|nr:hypothetical protein GCM10008106_32250 [Mongoliitalea lutea]